MTRGMGSQWCLSSADPCAKQHLSLSEHVPSSKCLHRDVLYFLLSIQIMLDEHVSRALRQQVFMASAPIHLKISKLQAATSRLDRLVGDLRTSPPQQPIVHRQQLVRSIPLVEQKQQTGQLRQQWQSMRQSILRLVDKLSGLQKRVQNTELRIVELMGNVNSHHPASYTIVIPEGKPHPPPLLHTRLNRISMQETVLHSLEERTERLESVLTEVLKSQSILGRLKSEGNILTYRSVSPKSTGRSPAHLTTDRPTASTARKRIQRRKMEAKDDFLSSSKVGQALMADF